MGHSSRRRSPSVILQALRWVALFLLLPAGPTQGQSSPPPSREALPFLRIGYITFESTASDDPDYRAATTYLRRVSHRSTMIQPDSPGLTFSIAKGNYYQVMHWMKTGRIEGAFVSPLAASLLVKNLLAVPVADFSVRTDYLADLEADLSRLRQDWPVPETLDQLKQRGHWAAIRCEEEGKRNENPVQRFREYLDGVFTFSEATVRRQSPPERKRARLEMVSHLSTSGFALPAIFAKKWFLARLGAVGKLSDEERRAVTGMFWKEFFKDVYFSLDRQAPLTATSLLFEFSYSGRPPGKLGSAVSTDPYGNPKQWRILDIPDTKGGLPWGQMPNDLLILRKDIHDLISRLFVGDALASVWDHPATTPNPVHERLYSSPRPHDAASFNLFRAWLLRELGINGAPKKAGIVDPLAEHCATWYIEGRYEFRWPSILAMLREDQKSSGIEHLSLVLPGGGVKSVYQAVLLDRLYGDNPTGTCFLRNEGAASQEGTSSSLVVKDIIGTSGGALSALLTATKNGTQGKPALASFWKVGDKIVAKSTAAFAFFDLPRAISLYFIFLMLVTLQMIGGKFSAWVSRVRTPRPISNDCVVVPVAGATIQRAPSDTTAQEPPFGLRLVLLTVVVLLPPALFKADSTGEYAKTTHGFVYLACVLSSLFVACCVNFQRSGPAQRIKRPALRFLLGILCGLLILALLSAVGHYLGYGAALWTFLILPATAIVGALKKTDCRFHDAARFFFATLSVVLVMIVSYGVTLVMALLFGVALLEVVPTFWYVLVPSSFGVCAIFLLMWGRKYDPSAPPRSVTLSHLLRDGFHYLGCHRSLGFLFPRVRQLTAVLLLLCGVLWHSTVGLPGLYSHETAYDYFTSAVTESHEKSANGPVFTFRSNVIATGSNFTEQNNDFNDVYFYFPRTGKTGEAAPIQVRESPKFDNATLAANPDMTKVIKRVFASGAPFPIFPPQRIPGVRIGYKKDESTLDLVDGGYSHNIPLEAAMLGGARQVLILRYEPTEYRGTPLYREPGLRSFFNQGQALLGYLFQRSQGLDERAGDDMLVAVLSCRDEVLSPNDAPFLATFTAATINKIFDAAQKDYSETRWMGTVESWGQPKPGPLISSARYYPVRPNVGNWTATLQSHLLTFAYDPAFLPTPRETNPVREGVLKAETQIDSSHAVFDFDGTCIHNDIGEAVFLSQIVEFFYEGDRPEFWELFPEPAVRDRLRDYWKSDLKAARFSLDATDSWSPDFRKYVSLFYQCYLDLLEKDKGEAYAWIVRLFMGKPPDQVRRFCQETFDRELKSPLKPLDLSTGTRTVLVNRGIRVYPSVRTLIQTLTDSAWEVHIISASSEYAVQAAAARAGLLPRDRVHGIRLQEENGLLTSRLAPPRTYKEGKVDRIRQLSLRPQLAVGDSDGDLAMLKASARLAVAFDRKKILQSDVTEPPLLILEPVTSLENEVGVTR